MAKHGYYPAPVYEAVFPSGETVRMSFWSQEGKEIDVARGRRLVTSCVGTAPLHGFVCFNGKRTADDHSAQVIKPRFNARLVIDRARKALESGDTAAALALLQAA
jgi:hypothetical protein